MKQILSSFSAATAVSVFVLALTLEASAGLKHTIHYDDFCGGGGEDKTNPMSVLFREGIYGGDGEIVGPCVCFGIGVYRYHKLQKCSTSPTLPYHLHVSNPVCVHLPADARAFRKMSEDPEFSKDRSTPLNSLFPECNNAIFSRKKREDPPAPSAPVTTKLGDEADEDFLNTGTEVGHELMRNQMNQYIETVISKLTGLGGEGGAEKTGGRKYPAIKLLEYTKQIMQKTCAPVNPDFFDLALNSFINLQLETYHIKEPYIGYSAYKRIELAMTRCLTRAKPHMFVLENANPEKLENGEICENKLPTKASNQTVLNAGTGDEEIKDIVIPPYASSTLEKGTIAEPLIETVWKMLVSAHSYCYMYFSDYFNDHHTYTVALLPLFTNAIQDIWLKGGEGYDLSGENKLYGGLLGNVSNILGDVDWCVGASRVSSPYPWFMNRPLLDKSNVWNRRRKREAGMAEDETEEEIESVAGRVLLEDQVFSHECKRDVLAKDVCVDYETVG